MQALIPIIDNWRESGEEIAIATVVSTWGSSPRPPGSKMALTASGKFEGSVTMGCVEGQVIVESNITLTSGKPTLLEYGVANDTAWDVGLTCGGKISIWLEPFTFWGSTFPKIKAAIKRRETATLITLIDGPADAVGSKSLLTSEGWLTDPALTDKPEDILKAMKGYTAEIGDRRYLIDRIQPEPRLFIVGAVHIAEALAPMAKLTGFEVVIIDPRRAFLTEERFPGFERIGIWPDKALADAGLGESDYVAALSHDPKIDDPAIITALKADATYVGTLGSKSTRKARIERLHDAGFDRKTIQKLYSPIGLKIGGRGAGEIAASILAEIISIRNS